MNTENRLRNSVVSSVSRLTPHYLFWSRLVIFSVLRLHRILRPTLDLFRARIPAVTDRQGLVLPKPEIAMSVCSFTEASQCYARGQIGFKSKELKSRQAGNSPQVIAYADKANERLRRRYYKMVLGKSKKHNVAKTAIARELACFMWGMMTEHIA